MGQFWEALALLLLGGLFFLPELSLPCPSLYLPAPFLLPMPACEPLPITEPGTQLSGDFLPTCFLSDFHHLSHLSFYYSEWDGDDMTLCAIGGETISSLSCILHVCICMHVWWVGGG